MDHLSSASSSATPPSRIPLHLREEEADACLKATEAYLQELAVEVLDSRSIVELEDDTFTVVVKLNSSHSLVAARRCYYEEDLDLHRYVHLENWILIDQRKLDEEIDNIFEQPYAINLVEVVGEDVARNSVARHLLSERIKRRQPYSYDGKLKDLIAQWRELIKLKL